MPFINTKVRESVQFYEAYAIGLFLSNYKFNGSNLSSLQNLSVDISKNPARIDKWYQIVYMFDSDTSYLFLDGKFQQKNQSVFGLVFLLLISLSTTTKLERWIANAFHNANSIFFPVTPLDIA